MRIVDLRCTSCEREFANEHVSSGPPYSRCPACGGERDWMPGVFQTFEWGGPRFYNGLDRDFGSRSELLAYMKANDLQQAPCAEKVGGARHEEYLKLGTAYSFKGQGRRGDYGADYGRSKR